MKIEGKTRIGGVILGKIDGLEKFERELNGWLKTKGLEFRGMITDEWEGTWSPDDELQKRRNRKKK